MRIKLVMLLLTTAIMQVSANSFGQTVTIKQKNISLLSVFDQIRKQTGYDFIYSDKVLEGSRPVDLDVEGMSVEKVLEISLRGQQIAYEIDNRIVSIRRKDTSIVDQFISYMTNIDVRGRVVDENDNPLPGATVSVKGTRNYVATDDAGFFTLKNVPDDALVEIHHIGYRNREVKAVRELGNLVLTVAVSELEEVGVVSTGYQKLPKERATGSFSTVENELFNQQVGTDILSRLPTIANGMVMDNGKQGRPQMMIRGLSTISGPKDVLIIVDNFPYDGDLTNINPNIVESITLLKDASASSIWGARAANGVIVITTRSGKFNQPISLSFNSNLTIGAKPDLDYIRQMSSNDYIDMEQELFKRNFYNSQINSTSRPVISPVVDLLNKVRSGAITQEQAQQQINLWRTIDARDLFDQYMYKPAVNQQYFLNVQGGSEKFSWTSSLGYDNNKDNLGSTYQRINLRFQNTYHPLKKLSLATGVYYTQSQNGSGRSGYTAVNVGKGGFVPYMQMADAQGNALPVAKQWNQNYVQTAGNGMLLDWNYYPLTDWQHQTSKSSVSDILLTAALDYQIIKGLNATVNYQYERQLGSSTGLADENSYMARDYINRFTQIVNGSPVFNVPRGGILDKSNNVLNANNLRGQLNFDNTYGRHNITAIAGAEIRSIDRNGNQQRIYGYNVNNLSTGSVDYAHTYPTLPSGSTYIARVESVNETATNFFSQFANAAYTFDKRYVVSASVRRDASNLFGVKTNDQWNPFWSAGIAWKISNEKFYDLGFLPYLNLRATYGFSGNIDPAMVAVNTIAYSANNSTINGNPMAYFNNYYNPLLKWETSRMINVAIDFRFKNNRISGAIEYYNKKGDNLFGAAPADYTTGLPPEVVRNVASMKGNGWDVELKSLNVDRMIKWNTILNFSMYQDRIEEYLITRTTARQYVLNAVPISGISGKPVYAIYAYKWAGLDPATGEAQGYLNGTVSKNYASITGTGTKVEELDYFGSAIPTKFGSFINTVSYKNISLQLAISFKLGYYFRRSSVNYTNLLNDWRGHSDYALRWQKPGDEAHTNVPVNQYTTNTNRDAFYNGSSVLVEKGDHIRLQYINLAYDIIVPANGTGKKGIKGLQVFVNANNLGLLWKANKAGLDPDFNSNANSMVTPANYAIGLKTKF